MFFVFSRYERQNYKTIPKIVLFFVQNSIAVKTVELLAPAKDYASAVVAVRCGGPMPSIGGARFGARQAAGNDAEDCPRRGVRPRFGVRVHATLNTLLWDEEPPRPNARPAAVDRCRSRRPDRAGHGPAADEPSRGAARLDAGLEPHARGGRASWASRVFRGLFSKGRSRSTKSGPSAPPRRPRSRFSSTGRSASGTAAAASSRGRCPGAAATAGLQPAPAACRGI